MVDAAAFNLNVIITILANGLSTLPTNGLSTLPTKGYPVFNNDPESLPKNPPDCPILSN